MEVTGMSQGGQLPLNLDANVFETTSDSVKAAAGGSGTVQQLQALENQIFKSANGTGVDVKNMKDAADQANKIMEETQTHLKFEVYGKFNDIVVQVLDDSTNEVIKEVPPKKLIDMVEKFCELSGFFMDEKA
ncbi:MAG: flagellar protein FlaG [Clostridium sp.]|jgi:flagellar protein FlaG|uniref:flagellar protein FlaG n=1 Tax=Clostridium sp. TaxID=1506 RepID=UPI0025C46D4E|nr:flagellar protein FlaG [Clostridium sp.]MCH3964328.1 flagellar protein FlaG [Clostridium sp.]MCI1715503.1 flagellar protein FlaG [Clostridium sp.]MCI1799705.1 flagellar protein FlaG [Clostridium sp.]MCI1813687.1 flagellar protein FlaG [Clostridium sp.]MCI1870518.1 flagellar protein FlaG [Clostridium sp.]